MERLVAERESGGAFASLDALATRVDPRLLNKRQLETLAAAGAFDAIEPNRAGVFAVAETLLAVAGRVQDQRQSGQGGLFGSAEVAGETIKLPLSARWTMADRMEQEKEAFGFYFSAHPVDRFKMFTGGATLFARLGEIHIPPEGRATTTMAVLVGEARWRTSAKGRRYLMATLSDPSGQFAATCFDDGTAATLEEAARTGGCGLATVELDRRNDDEAPRVTVKRLQPFDGMASETRMLLDITIDAAEGVAAAASLLAQARGGRGEVRLAAAIPGGTATLVLGRDFLLDAELAGRIEKLQAVRDVVLAPAPAGRLALAQ